MRVPLLFSLILSTTLAQAEPIKPAAFEHVFDLAGIRLLCEQSGPLIERGLPDKQQKQVAKAFAADAICADLAKRLVSKVTDKQLEQASLVLDSPLAQRFTVAERAVGEGDGGQGLASYREQLNSKPPRAERVALVQRLDKAAHTTELATLLRYEVGKTQALLALRAKGQSINEATLSTQTAKQVEPLRTSSAQAVQSFMLYAYRQMPSGELADYAAVYEQEAVSQLLSAAVKELPAVFAARRMALK
ncbi:hypothetical protein ACVW0Y_001235 [Pseudomonas sp. TE3786]